MTQSCFQQRTCSALPSLTDGHVLVHGVGMPGPSHHPGSNEARRTFSDFTDFKGFTGFTPRKLPEVPAFPSHCCRACLTGHSCTACGCSADLAYLRAHGQSGACCMCGWRPGSWEGPLPDSGRTCWATFKFVHAIRSAEGHSGGVEA